MPPSSTSADPIIPPYSPAHTSTDSKSTTPLNPHKKLKLPPSRRSVYSLAALLAAITFPISLLWFIWFPPLALIPTAVAAYLPSYFDRSEYYPNNTRVWKRYQKSVVWRYLLSYFKPEIHVVSEETRQIFNDSTKQCIICCHPHGIMSYNHFLFMTDCAGFMSDIYHGPPRRDLAANVLFKIPLLRDLVLWLGNIDAGRRNADNVLAGGYSLQLYTGGEREQMHASNESPTLVIKRRKGIARLALEYNVPIIPVFTFGEDQTYKPSKFMLKQRLWLVKKFQIAITLQRGRWNLPFTPMKAKYDTVIGGPVQLSESERKYGLKRGSNGKYEYSDEDVKKLLDKYANAMVQLFEDHKEKYSGYKNDASMRIM